MMLIEKGTHIITGENGLNTKNRKSSFSIARMTISPSSRATVYTTIEFVSRRSERRISAFGISTKTEKLESTAAPSLKKKWVDPSVHLRPSIDSNYKRLTRSGILHHEVKTVNPDFRHPHPLSSCATVYHGISSENVLRPFEFPIVLPKTSSTKFLPKFSSTVLSQTLSILVNLISGNPSLPSGDDQDDINWCFSMLR
jgi:hypothetical protein